MQKWIWWRPRGQHRPEIVVAEQPVGGALHEHQVVEVGADAAEDAEDQLQEDRRLEQPAVDAMREIVEVADVVALVLELDAVALAQQLDDVLDVAEGVAEDVSVGADGDTAPPSRTSSSCSGRAIG